MTKAKPTDMFKAYVEKLECEEKITKINNMFKDEISILEKRLSDLKSKRDSMRDIPSIKLESLKHLYNNELEEFMDNIFNELGVTSQKTKNIIVSGIESAIKNKQKYYYFNPLNPLHNNISSRDKCFTIDLKSFEIELTRSENLKRLIGE